VARLDPRTERVVLRLVYDGPAWAGKTTTVRSLARGLGTHAVSGEEADGRTLEFDWADYLGGLFRGQPIHCQIVGVPGQRVLERRRLALLAEADVVVFVADSRPALAEENVRAFASLRRALAERDPPVAIVVQANKRDLPDAIPLDDLRELLGADETVAITGSVAGEGDGIRETFVLAVRLALDRARAMRELHGLPSADSPDDDLGRLFARIGAVSEEPASAAPAAESAPLPAAEPPTSPTPPGRRGPRRPDADAAAGLVWPPVHGRVIVHEAARTASPALARNAAGDWVDAAGGWVSASPAEALFFDLETGRQALIAWARWHSLAGTRLSSPRALVLAEAAPGAWRLWQIVRDATSLADRLARASEVEPREAGAHVLDVAESRIRAEQELVTSGWLPRIGLDEISAARPEAPSYCGLAPYPVAETGGGGEPDAAREDEILRDEIAPALAEVLRAAPGRLGALLEGLGLPAATPERRRRAQAIRDALLAS
jgi:signal recognition particle receptor subunit beta